MPEVDLEALAQQQVAASGKAAFTSEEWELEELQRLKAEAEAEYEEEDLVEDWDRSAADAAYREKVEKAWLEEKARRAKEEEEEAARRREEAARMDQEVQEENEEYQRQLASSLARNPKLRHVVPSAPASATTSHASGVRSGSAASAPSEAGEECASLRRPGSVGAAAKRRLADMAANGVLPPAADAGPPSKRAHVEEASDSGSEEDTSDTVPFSATVPWSTAEDVVLCVIIQVYLAQRKLKPEAALSSQEYQIAWLAVSKALAGGAAGLPFRIRGRRRETPSRAPADCCLRYRQLLTAWARARGATPAGGPPLGPAHQDGLQQKMRRILIAGLAELGDGMPAQVLLTALHSGAVENRNRANIALPEYTRSLLTTLSPDLTEPAVGLAATPAPPVPGGAREVVRAVGVVDAVSPEEATSLLQAVKRAAGVAGDVPLIGATTAMENLDAPGPEFQAAMSTFTMTHVTPKPAPKLPKPEPPGSGAVPIGAVPLKPEPGQQAPTGPAAPLLGGAPVAGAVPPAAPAAPAPSTAATATAATATTPATNTSVAARYVSKPLVPGRAAQPPPAATTAPPPAATHPAHPVAQAPPSTASQPPPAATSQPVSAAATQLQAPPTASQPAEAVKPPEPTPVASQPAPAVRSQATPTAKKAEAAPASAAKQRPQSATNQPAPAAAAPAPPATSQPAPSAKQAAPAKQPQAAPASAAQAAVKPSPAASMPGMMPTPAVPVPVAQPATSAAAAPQLPALLSTLAMMSSYAQAGAGTSHMPQGFMPTPGSFMGMGQFAPAGQSAAPAGSQASMQQQLQMQQQLMLQQQLAALLQHHAAANAAPAAPPTSSKPNKSKNKKDKS